MKVSQAKLTKEVAWQVRDMSFWHRITVEDMERGHSKGKVPKWEWVWTVCSRNGKQTERDWWELNKSEHDKDETEDGGGTGWPAIPDGQGTEIALGMKDFQS